MPKEIQNRDRLLFQYKNGVRFQTLMDGLFDFFKGNSKSSLYDIFDVDLAEGEWLDLIGNLIDVYRPFVLTGNAFTLDDTLTDDDDYQMDGDGVPAPDDLYRLLINNKIKINNSRQTTDEIQQRISDVVGIDRLVWEENVKDITNLIYLTGDTRKKELLYSLNAFDRKWFGLPAGVKLGNVLIIEVPTPTTEIFRFDYSDTDDLNVVII
jgi:hypothetical protein